MPKISKKSKSAWRKHANIDDVEEFLEEKRFEERMIPNISIIPDEELFLIDNKSDPNLLSAKERKQLRLNRPLKCFSLLESHTKVADPITKRNHVRTKEERKSLLIKNKEDEKRRKGILKPSEVQSVIDKEYTKKKKEALHRKNLTKDIWCGDDEKFPIEKQEWILDNTKKHNLKGISKLKMNRLHHHKKTILPSVETPHPGMSYNPSYDDHQELIKIIADKELSIIKDEEHVKRVTSNMFKKVTEEIRNENRLKELSVGLEGNEENNENDELTDDDYKNINPPVLNIKKTKKQKRKQKEQKRLLLERMAIKLQKKKSTDIQNIKLLKEVLDARDKELAVEKEKRNKIKLLKEKQTKRLGNIKFKETELEFNLGEDISGNLRNLKQEGNLLVDRFKSLQKRNIIEPSIQRIRKKAKVKKYINPGHKEDWKKTVAR